MLVNIATESGSVVMTNEIERQKMQELITALANTTCSKCKGTSCAAADEHGIITDWTPCSDCNGTGRNPLTELLRVKCTHWAHEHATDHSCYNAICITHRATCLGIRPATPEEAEAVGLKLLEVFPGYKVYKQGFPGKPYTVCIYNEERHRIVVVDAPTSLEAILAAIAEALGAEVTV